jgi:hypothetical protein
MHANAVNFMRVAENKRPAGGVDDVHSAGLV